MIVSTTIASVMLLFGRLREPETIRLVRLAVVMVELLTVVVVNVLVPVKLLLPVRVAMVDVPLKLLNERPIIFEPVKFTVPFWTDRLVVVAFTNIVEVAKRLVEVALVNTAVEAPITPIGVLFIVPPSIVRPFTTMVSVMEFDGSERAPVTARFVEVMLLAAVFTKTVVVAKRLVEVTLTEFILFKSKLDAAKFVALSVVKKPLVEVIDVARTIVEVTAVPEAEVKKSGPVSVPPANGR